MPQRNITCSSPECSRHGSVTGTASERWSIVDVALNNTRGSSQRLREKREKIRQATSGSSSASNRSPRKQSSHDQVKGLEQQLRAAERRARDAEQREQVAQRRCKEAERQLEESLRREQITQHELQGKTKELAAHSTEVWKIPTRNVSTVSEIGYGGWGAVFQGNLKVAVKRLHGEIVSSHNMEKVRREMKLLAEVQHPNLVQFIGAVFDRSPPLIVTELLDINLRQAYQQNRLEPGDRLSIFRDIARALDYLHQRYEPIIHRDVSTPNVLLLQMPDNHWKGKVSDLGSANFLRSAQTMGEGAILYSPPEVIPQAFDPLVEPPKQTVKIDVYSYGIVLCEVCTSRFPKIEDYRDMILQVQKKHPQVFELILNCTKKNPLDRTSMAEVLEELSKMNPF